MGRDYMAPDRQGDRLTVADARAEFGEWGNSLVVQRGRDLTGRTFEEEIGRYLQAGDGESFRLK